ncbi:MAG: terpene cyclase/mutase family protein [Gemmataceae bacterium]|nr:terpene cyclase/mutase family protein [Gemmataceae bacterium]MCI0738786.1 terpene cyclase/mutase family protein [Gemmataceae bacterium]
MSAQGKTPVVVLSRTPKDSNAILWRMAPAALGSVVFHAASIGLLVLFLRAPNEAPAMEEMRAAVVNADPFLPPEKKDPFLTPFIDEGALNPFSDPAAPNERKADITMPGQNDPREEVGLLGGKSNLPTSMPAPPGWGGGQGSGPFGLSGPNTPGLAGGETLLGKLQPGGIDARSGSAKKFALDFGGGTKASEAAVTRGLQWLCQVQHADGKWALDDSRFPDRGGANDIAGTAFGLLPLLGAGKTHKAKDAPYDKPVEKAFLYLLRKQDKRTGYFGGGMYAHGLATIAICEAYGMTQDPTLRRPAQMAINYIVQAQHDAGGWRYSPGQAGDTSVVGWQAMALKSAQMANLDVPEITMRKAQAYLDSCCGQDEGYGYIGVGSTPTMSAVGLLCRQYLQSWGPQNLRMIKGVENFLKPNPPNPKSIYYTYYASQVMHHFGGEGWKVWNEKMRDALQKAQEDKKGPFYGSWSSAGDPHGPNGGRLMQTSLSLLTLEVYYRHLPLYYRDADLKKMASGK